VGDDGAIGGTTAEIAVEAAAVARNRRRDMGMRTVMEILRLQE
jgi:hypothetical protein